MKTKTIMIICAGLPYPPNDGVRTRVYNISRQLLEEFNLKIISIIKDDRELMLLPEAQRMLNNSIFPVSVQYSFLEKICRGIVNIFQVRPLEYHFYYFDEVANKIVDVFQKENIDFVQFERSFLTVYKPHIPKDTPTVINLYDYESLRHRRIFELAPLWKKPLLFWNLKRIKYFESESISKSKHIFAISEAEKVAILHDLNVSENRLDLLTGGIDTEAYPFIEAIPNEKNIIFVGSGMSFNYDAIRYFYYQILPRIRNFIPGVKWYLVGKLDRARLNYLLNDPAVEFCPNVESVIPYYEKCRLLVVPLRGGGGTRLKIFEAMAIGRPIVSTTIGCEGIGVTSGKNILVADDVNEFASAVCELLVNDEKNHLIRSNAYEFVKETFGWRRVCRSLISYYKNNAGKNCCVVSE